MFRKGKSAVEGDSMKSQGGIETKGKVEQKEVSLEVTWWGTSIKRTADEIRQRSTKIIDEKTDKYRAKNAYLQNTSTDLKEATFLILKNYASELNRKERLSPTSKARREASRNKFAKKDGVPDRGKIFGEVNSGKYRPRTRLGLVKPIRNRLRNIKDFDQE